MRARHPERRRELAAVDDRRAAAVAVEDPRQRRRQPMAQEDDAVGLAPVQHLRILLLAVAFVAGIAQQHGTARLLRRFLHPANAVGKERVGDIGNGDDDRLEEHTSELQSLMSISYAVFSMKTKNTTQSTISQLDILII